MNDISDEKITNKIRNLTNIQIYLRKYMRMYV